MGKYKQWLHHQEVGRRLREQIATHEQERERVQRMAPSHPTTLPDTNNPLVRALLDYTGRGGTLGRAPGGRIASVAGANDADPHQPQPARMTGAPQAAPAPLTGAPSQAPAQPALTSAPDAAILAQLNAQAAQMPADPIEAMRKLAQAQSQGGQPDATAAPTAPLATPPEAPAPEGATTGEWWQRYRSQS
jgi:hypothetical protein